MIRLLIDCLLGAPLLALTFLLAAIIRGCCGARTGP